MAALVAEVFGDRGGVARALHAHQRRRIGRRGHHHAACAALFLEDVLDEFLDLAAALADQADDDDIGRRVARHHAQQHRLADAGAGEQAEALAAADGEQRVDRAHAGVERLAHRVAVHRVDGAPRHRLGAHLLQRAETVERHAVRIDDAAEQAVAHRQVQAAVLAAPPRVVLDAEARRHVRHRAGHHQRAAGQAVQLAVGHQEGAVAVEADHLGQHRRLAVAAAQFAHRAHRHAHAGRFEHQAGHAHQRADAFQRLRQCGVGLQIDEEAGPALGAGGRVGFAAGADHVQSCGVVVGPRQLAAQHRGGLLPARLDARIDVAEVGFDAARRRVRSAASPSSRAPRACSASAAPSATQGRSAGLTVTLMCPALSSTASTACCATCATCCGWASSSLRTTRAPASRRRSPAPAPSAPRARRAGRRSCPPAAPTCAAICWANDCLKLSSAARPSR